MMVRKSVLEYRRKSVAKWKPGWLAAILAIVPFAIVGGVILVVTLALPSPRGPVNAWVADTAIFAGIVMIICCLFLSVYLGSVAWMDGGRDGRCGFWAMIASSVFVLFWMTVLLW